MQQLASLLKVEWIFTKRNITTLGLTIGMPVFYYLLFSGLYQGQMPPQAQALMLISMTISSVISFNIFVLPFNINEDKGNNWLTYLQHSPVSMVQYFIAKAVRLMLYYLLAMGIIFTLGITVRGIELSLGQWLTIVAVIIVGMVPFALMGILTSYLPGEQAISLVSNVLYMFLALIGGLWIPMMLFPKWLQSIGKGLPSYHLMQIVQHAIYDNSLEWQSVGVLGLYSVGLIAAIAVVRRVVVVR